MARVVFSGALRQHVGGVGELEIEARSYRELLRAPGLSMAKALQNAQKNLLAQPRYRHPAYWAPFLLIGNWL